MRSGHSGSKATFHTSLSKESCSRWIPLSAVRLVCTPLSHYLFLTVYHTSGVSFCQEGIFILPVLFITEICSFVFLFLNSSSSQMLHKQIPFPVPWKAAALPLSPF